MVRTRTIAIVTGILLVIELVVGLVAGQMGALGLLRVVSVAMLATLIVGGGVLVADRLINRSR